MLRVFRDIDGLLLTPQGSVVCIGAFDGLHLGHQTLLRNARARAHTLNVPLAVVSFEPLPREFFARIASPPQAPPARLMLPGARMRGLAGLGVEVLGLLRFNAQLVAMSAQEFVQRVLVGRLGAREVWVGPGFRFGHGRAGDVQLLQALGGVHGFTAGEIAPFETEGVRVSSTGIRTALAQGDFATAAAALGRPYAITGRVVRGQQLGRTLGFPTANLRFNKQPPLQGIFAVRVHGVGNTPKPGVASFGIRPTVGGVEPLLETHLFDFDGDLYARRIEVEFVAKLRDEQKFDSLNTLTQQMHRDAHAARHVLDALHSTETHTQ